MRFRILLQCMLLMLPVQMFAQNIEFIENRGQWDGPFRYKAMTGKSDVFLENNCFTYIVGSADNNNLVEAFHHGHVEAPPILKYHVYKVQFEGSATPTIIGDKPQTTYYNYFLGKDPSRWQSGVHPNYAIDYRNLYKNIDMRVSSNKGNMEYDFIIQPTGDPSQIRLSYKGVDDLRLKGGNLYIPTSVGEITEMKPYAYQYINDAKVEVTCRYKLNENIVSFDLPDSYDHTQPLIIDPVIVFCSFTGSTADNWGFTATYDAQGNFYAGGICHDLGYPVSTGAFQTIWKGGYDYPFPQPSAYSEIDHGSGYADDIAIMKFNAAGTQRIYATYIGGTDNEQPHSLIVDANNNLIIAGRTYSHDFPVTPGAYNVTENGDADIVVVKLNAAGTALIGSTYVGGSGQDVINFSPSEYQYGNLKHNYGDDARSEVQVDKQGNIYVAASTKSTNFPTVNAVQTTLKGSQDAVVIKLNSTLSTMLWSTYLGGSAYDAGYVLAFDTSQAFVYIGGGTQSYDFPGTVGSYLTTNQGGTGDGWISKFQNWGGYPLVRTTYIGAAGYDQVYGLQIDVENSVYAMGQTLGGVFPVSPGVYSNPNSSQFIIKLDSNLTTRALSTVFGSGNSTLTNISPVAFLVDTCENIYISGWGGSLGIGTAPASAGTTNMPITGNAAQSTTDGNDFYFICLSKNMQNLLYATYFGSNNIDPDKGEHVDGGTSRFDKYGIIYEAICGGCAGNLNTSAKTHFPTQPSNVWSLSDSAFNCNEVALKIAFQFGPVNASANPLPSGTGCLPFAVQFQNLSTNGVSYNWDFGDGSAQSTAFAPSHTFTSVGHFTVRLIVKNANACTKTIDTGYATIIVDTGIITPQFTFARLDSCGPYIAKFTNTSQHGGAGTKYVWTFGDNTSYTGTTPPAHTFPAAGNYTVTLTMTDTSACNATETVTHVVTFSGLKVKAGFSANDTVCINTTTTFTNTAANGSIFTYYLSNGKSVTGSSGTTSYTFTDTGTLLITQVVSNPGACNGLDTFKKKIYVTRGPIADFSFAPVVPVVNLPITFTNLSTGAVRYAWDFGDNATSTEVNPVHLYKHTGQFNACLTAYNILGCPTVLCKTTSSDILPLADLPTAFSPNGDGVNEILFVRGAAIQTMNLMIFNRWGQLVFETNDQNKGWDGTYNGKPQEMDAYAYVLRVTFIDGSTLQKKGNVTLLR